MSDLHAQPPLVVRALERGALALAGAVGLGARVGAAPASPSEPVAVRIEVSRGSFAKRDASGRMELPSPVPCPYNYGSVPGTVAPDGDPEDAIVLGPPLAFGELVEAPRWAVVRFVDEGVVDDKWVCAAVRPRDADLRRLAGFFRCYALIKRLADRLRGHEGPTRFLGVERIDVAPTPTVDRGR